jgi:rhodanese-related sulfurtransferase
LRRIITVQDKIDAAAAGTHKASIRSITAAEINAMLRDGDELALLDVREELTYSQSHLLHARSAPLSRLELIVPHLVPRRGTRTILIDDGGGAAQKAAEILHRHGYSSVFVFADGLSSWTVAGYVLFSGVNVPSKAFGEVVEHANETPSIDAAELKQMIDSGSDMVIVDSRPYGEYSRVSIPTSTNVPGAELVLRMRDVAPSPATTVVVNCAGRTRSIIGAQSLINAGLPNKVIALRNGTMGWTLAGFAPDQGKNRRLPAGAPSQAALDWAKSAAANVATRAGVKVIDLATLDAWRKDSDRRTLYLFDVRDPREYERGHLPGALSAPGGQLIQATDQYVGTFHSRIVLVDDLEVRAQMTASWLAQMGWNDVYVLVASGDERGAPPADILVGTPPAADSIDPASLAALLARGTSTVIDLATSRDYRKSHIPGAWFAIRSRLKHAIAKIDLRGTIVLTSEDGILATLALDEAKALLGVPVRVLAGGNAAWLASGRELTAADARFADEAIDVWLKPYERTAGATAAMSEYLSWEVDLLERIDRDGTCHFSPLTTDR